ncbi:MAG TPA: MBL fold metallo-hydrolase [Steroidobacteraceae bacterium]|nr:MBL fold metallo-hydrolase [Steroidobacteraceae bacterium]
MLQATIIQYPHGITAIDTGYIRPGLAAAHLIVEAGHAAFIDVGTNDSVPRLLAALEHLGIARAAVDFVLLTHVHLDHAGGAGVLLTELPNARAVVHPRGAPHLADPARLIAASIAVYGEAHYRALYGEIAPIPRERILLARNGERIELGGRRLLTIDTPGHALHHCSILDEAHANVFTGDTFGLSYRELDTAAGAFVLPTTTPTQFDPEQLIASIDRILELAPQAAFLMHFSRITGLQRIGESLKAQVRELAALARRHAADPDREVAIREEMRSLWHARARAHGITLPGERLDQVLGMDLELNAQGLVAWLERTA